jgi:hypothetical protein
MPYLRVTSCESPRENRSKRCCGGVMVYGFGTRSYFNSTEHRTNKRQQKEVTAKYLAGDLKVGNCVAGPICRCRSFDLPHEISRHKELKSDKDWRTESERKSVEYWW